MLKTAEDNGVDITGISNTSELAHATDVLRNNIAAKGLSVRLGSTDAYVPPGETRKTAEGAVQPERTKVEIARKQRGEGRVVRGEDRATKRQLATEKRGEDRVVRGEDRAEQAGIRREDRQEDRTIRLQEKIVKKPGETREAFTARRLEHEKTVRANKIAAERATQEDVKKEALRRDMNIARIGEEANAQAYQMLFDDKVLDSEFIGPALPPKGRAGIKFIQNKLRNYAYKQANSRYKALARSTAEKAKKENWFNRKTEAQIFKNYTESREYERAVKNTYQDLFQKFNRHMKPIRRRLLAEREQIN